LLSACAIRPAQQIVGSLKLTRINDSQNTVSPEIRHSMCGASANSSANGSFDCATNKSRSLDHLSYGHEEAGLIVIVVEALTA
jgi:hypothetical protein